jgi:signal transduction histidine kinase
MAMLVWNTILPVIFASIGIGLLILAFTNKLGSKLLIAVACVCAVLGLLVVFVALIEYGDANPSLAGLGMLVGAFAIWTGSRTTARRDTPDETAAESQRDQPLGDLADLRKTIMMFSVFNSLKDLVLVVNHSQMVIFMNQAAVDRLGDMVGMNCRDVLRCESDSCRGCQVGNQAEENAAPSNSELALNGRMYELSRNAMRNDDDGRVIITARDTTARRMVERQLLINEKMVSLGQLVAGVAHEINNPITFVFTNLELLTMMHNVLGDYLDKLEVLLKSAEEDSSPSLVDLASSIRQYCEDFNISDSMEQLPLLVEDLTEGVIRVKKIVKDLKEFSHAGGVEPENANINEILEQTLRVAHNELKSKATVECHMQAEMPPLSGLPQQLKQAFLNLVVNAAQAMDNTPPDHSTLKISSSFKDDYFTVIIADTGKGIPASDLDHIFEPFWTSKGVGKGTGLGLSVVYGIIERHGGEIRVNSKVGEGTTFTVTLPKTMPTGEKTLAKRGVSIYSS